MKKKLNWTAEDKARSLEIRERALRKLDELKKRDRERATERHAES